MKLFFTNKVYHFLTVSRFLNTIGSSLYNIVFVIYAATVFHSKIMVGVANVTMVIPAFFTILVGIKADQTQFKKKWIVITGFTQAAIFTSLAFIISKHCLLAFSFICLFNILSDTLSDFSNGLRMPIIQKYVNKKDLIEAYSFTQFISYICNFSGQALGIWLLTISQHNFALVAIINAFSFMLSALVILIIKDDADYDVLSSDNELSFKEQFSNLYHNVMLIFNETNSADFIHLLLAILCLNMLSGSLNAIYNIWLLSAKIGHLSYSQALLLIEFILVGGILIGSLTPHDYFSQKSIRQLLKISAVIFFLVGLSNLIHFPLIIGILLLAFASYLVGKVNPKINSQLLSNLPANTLAQTNNFLTFLFTLSLPVGTVLFSSLSSWNITSTWITFLALAVAVFKLSASTKTVAD
ncbi:MAG: transporter [Streptococcus infantarius]|nr:transporter [Streptococcus infantarius]